MSATCAFVGERERGDPAPSRQHTRSTHAGSVTQSVHSSNFETCMEVCNFAQHDKLSSESSRRIQPRGG
jgi:hypothetical protein